MNNAFERSLNTDPKCPNRPMSFLAYSRLLSSSSSTTSSSIDKHQSPPSSLHKNHHQSTTDQQQQKLQQRQLREQQQQQRLQQAELTQQQAVQQLLQQARDQTQQLPSLPEEREEEYCYGGYHPVEINEKFGPNKNYQIVQKLGWGHFSTVWLAYDILTGKHVALKIAKSQSNYTEAAQDEIEILKKIKRTNPKHPGYKYLVNLLDSFTHRGPNGEHVVMVLELLGENLLGLLDKFKHDSRFIKYAEFKSKCGGLPLSIVKKISKQLCLAFDYLHKECGLIHTDIKPENILIEIKDVEKFLEYLGHEDPEDAYQQSGSLYCKKSLIKSSKPLPSPLSTFNNPSASSLASSLPKSLLKYHRKQLLPPSPETHCSVNYYENCIPSIVPVSIRQSTATHNVHVCASEATSDDELESDLDDDDGLLSTSSDVYFDSLDCYKTHTNVTTPPGSLASRRSTFETDLYVENSKIYNNHKVKNSCINVSNMDKLNQQYSSSNSNTSTTLDSSRNDLSLYTPSTTPSVESLANSEDHLSTLINIKVADLGNACFYNHHFSDEIQTRQYRSPEVILGHSWGCSADSWSFACLVFELITGDYLFHPKNGKSFSKNDDHLAQIIELLSPSVETVVRLNSTSTRARKYFQDDLWTMKRIGKLKFWGLKEVLIQKYKIPVDTAKQVEEFLLPLLNVDPEERMDLGSCLKSEFLKSVRLDGEEEVKSLETTKNGRKCIKGWSSECYY